MSLLFHQANSCYFTIATAGHVDHGKSSVVKALTGIDPDRLKEEKERQMTTDLGFAHTRIDDYQIGIIDVPGHGKFLKNMLAGVGALDLALLVVAADEGVMPQTVQHAKILSLLNVNKVLAVMTKLDCTEEAQRLDSLASIRKLCDEYDLILLNIVSVSCLTLQGFDELRSALHQSLTATSNRSEEILESEAYLPIDRVFKKGGHGLVVTGTLVRGSLSKDDSVYIEPAGLKARVRNLETFGQQLPMARAGQRLALNLLLKDQGKIERGQVVLSQPFKATRSLVVALRCIHDEFSDEDFGPKLVQQPVKIYHGTAEIDATVGWCQKRIINNDDGNHGDETANHIKWRTFVAQLILHAPLLIRPGERMIVRLGQDSIMGGVALLTLRPRALGRSTLLHLANLLIAQDYSRALLFYLEALQPQIATKSQLETFLPVVHLPLSDMSANSVVEIGEFIVLAHFYQCEKARLLEAVQNLERVSLQGAGVQGEGGQVRKVSLEQLKSAYFRQSPRLLFDRLIDELLNDKSLVREGDKINSAQARAKSLAEPVDEAEATLLERLVDSSGCMEIAALRSPSGLAPRAFDMAFQELVESGKIKIVAHDYVSSSRFLAKAHAALAEVWQEHGGITPSDFKEQLGITRKYAMALLSYFDDALITRRVAAGRVLLKAP